MIGRTRSANKASRGHSNAIAEAEQAAADVEKMMKEHLANGILTEGSREHLESKKALSDLRASIGLSRRRGR